MKQYGCIGKKLTHSFSKEIHAKLADYNYELIELTEEEIAPFFAKRGFAAINVTIPYKQTVIPYLDSISPIAQRIGAVNTIVNKDGNVCMLARFPMWIISLRSVIWVSAPPNFWSWM